MEEDMVVITLKSLPSSYEHFVETLNIASTHSDVSFSDLCIMPLQQDHQKQQFGTGTSSSSNTQAFSTKSTGNYQFSQSCQQNPSAQSLEGSKKKNVQCNYCNKFCHMKLECRKRLDTQVKQSSSQAQVHVGEHTEPGESSFYAFMAKRLADHVKSSAQYIDLGASCHFTHHRDWFTDFQPFSNSVIFGEEYTIADRGNIQIQSRGRKLIFLDVCYVPSMEFNLLSFSQIMRHSPQLNVTFSSHQCSFIVRETRSTVVVGVEDLVFLDLLTLGILRSLLWQPISPLLVHFGIGGMGT